jgi:two-component system nitrate/nitrite response regulator NarL
MSDRIRVAVVDDHPLYRIGVVQTLQSAPDIDVVAEGASAKDAVRIAATESLDVMLLDVSMHGSGIEAAREIRAAGSTVKLIMLTASEDASHVTSALRNGASGYVLKGCGGAELLNIVRAVTNDESYITPSLATRLLAQQLKPAIPEDEPTLTLRENQVLDLLSQGMMNKEIAHKLKLTEKTVKHYMTILMQKLQVRNRVEAVLAARKMSVPPNNADRR